MVLTPRDVLDAHGDAWQVEGLLRRPHGGDATELPGARLMASGLAHPQWNSGDVDDPAAVDLAQVRAWYAGRAASWGLRLAAGTPWPHGRRILTQSLWARTLDDLPTGAAVPGLELVAAGPDDLGDVLLVDSAAFGSDPAQEGPWAAPHLAADTVDVLLGRLDGVPVATGYSVRSDGRAGPAAHVGGIGVAPAYEGSGIGTALTLALLRRAQASGARFAHLEPETARAARVYDRLGFAETASLDIYLGMDG
ncbi:MAG: GNAT family N-acetyltransferase [Candidatus Nanopelagicales bacterium]